MTTATERRLRAAGWEPAPTVIRMVKLPSKLGTDELIFWRSPDGRTFTEAEALEQIEEADDE